VPICISLPIYKFLAPLRGTGGGQIQGRYPQLDLAALHSQPNISAYELGRRHPTWPTFVRLIAAMDQRPVIQIGPAERKLPLSYLLDHLDQAIRDVLTVVDGLPYRFESDAALQLLGQETTPDIVWVSAVADIEDLTQRAPDRLDRLINDAARPL
jgi:hypothetical protein